MNNIPYPGMNGICIQIELPIQGAYLISLTLKTQGVTLGR
jgi:hypothetical protein